MNENVAVKTVKIVASRAYHIVRTVRLGIKLLLTAIAVNENALVVLSGHKEALDVLPVIMFLEKEACVFIYAATCTFIHLHTCEVIQSKILLHH